MAKIFSVFKSNKELLKLTLPIFLELILGIFIGFVDQFQLSYDQNGVNAIGQVNTIVVLVNVTFQVLTTASIILITQYNGKNDKQNAEKVYRIAFYFNLVVSSIFSIFLFFFAEQFISLLKVEKEIIRHKAVLYMQFTGSWVVIQALISTFGSFLRANKKMMQSTYVSIIMNVLNVAGNAIAVYLIAKKDPSTDTGIIGVALSSTISKLVCLIVIVIMYIKYVGVSLSIIKTFKHFSFQTFKKLIMIGVPSAGETFSYNFAQTISMIIINQFLYPDVQGNIKMYISNVCTFVYIFASAISQAMQVQEGALIVNNKKEEAKKLIKDTRLMASIISFFMSVVILAIAYPLFSYLLKTTIEISPEISIANTQMYIINIVLIILSFNILLEQGRASNIVLVKGLQASGDIFVPVITAIISCWAIAVGGTYIFGTVCKLGVIGVFIANTIDECLRALIFYFRLQSDVWKKKNLIKSKEIEQNIVPLEEVEPLKKEENERYPKS